MNLAVQHGRLTFDQFLIWAAEQPAGRYELNNGRVVALSPERNRHIDTKMEAWLALRSAVATARLPLHVSGDGLTIKIDDDTSREPDVTVQPAPVDPEAVVAKSPVIVVEVVSPSSETIDKTAKLVEYFKVPSILHYLVIDPYRRVVIRHTRSDGSEIESSIFEAGPIALDPPGLVLETVALLGTTSIEAAAGE